LRLGVNAFSTQLVQGNSDSLIAATQITPWFFLKGFGNAANYFGHDFRATRRRRRKPAVGEEKQESAGGEPK